MLFQLDFQSDEGVGRSPPKPLLLHGIMTELTAAMGPITSFVSSSKGSVNIEGGRNLQHRSGRAGRHAAMFASVTMPVALPGKGRTGDLDAWVNGTSLQDSCGLLDA